jgi:phosphoribosylanthranilate isomerase
MRTRVKICGITRLEDARTAVAAGADALGFVFYPPSPRNVSVEQAADIACRIPPFVTRVGLFVNADRDTIAEVVERVGIDLIQFHGDECPDYCAGHGRPYIKAVRMKDDVDVAAERRRYCAAAALLLDAYRPGIPGGTGKAFDWQRIPAELAGEIILAGGLTPENVVEAIRAVNPYAVDVSGGVERAKGVKDPDKIHRFMQGVHLGTTDDILD